MVSFSVSAIAHTVLYKKLLHKDNVLPPRPHKRVVIVATAIFASSPFKFKKKYLSPFKLPRLLLRSPSQLAVVSRENLPAEGSL